MISSSGIVLYIYAGASQPRSWCWGSSGMERESLLLAVVTCAVVAAAVALALR
jgi:hypothetical protein